MIASKNSLVGWFQFLDSDSDGRIGGAQVADFFKRSNLSINTLRKIWELTAGQEAVLSEVQFLLAMSLISHAQYNGGSFTQEEAYGVIAGVTPQLPVPKIRGFTDEEWVFLNPFAASITSESVTLGCRQKSLQEPIHPNQKSGTLKMVPEEPSQITSRESLQGGFLGNDLDSKAQKRSSESESASVSCALNRTEAHAFPTAQTSIVKNINCSGCLQIYSAEDIRKATNGYASCLGGGGYGDVYKGSMSHVPVAVKILGVDVMQGVTEYEQEVMLLGKIRHPHIVTLYGKCDDKGALVYELLPGGNLEDKIRSSALHWETRLRIAKEMALGLVYMHTHDPPIVHRDLKPANILLDRHLTAKVGDMGLAKKMDGTRKESTAVGGVKGTFHYIAPEYENHGVYTMACDVYSFGVIILQLITNLPPNVVRERVSEAMRSGTLDNVLDKRVGTGNWPRDIIQDVAKLGSRCCTITSEHRPDMVEIVNTLKELHDLATAMKWSTSSAYTDNVDRLLMCPLSHKRIKDPVVADDGHTYERRVIEEWLARGYRTSPLNNTSITTKLVPNLMARSLLEWRSYSES